MARLTDEIKNGQRVVHVENEDEFWQVSEKGEGKFLIDAPESMAESLGCTDVVDGSE